MITKALAWLGLSKLRLVFFSVAMTGLLFAASGLYLKGRIDQRHANQLAVWKEANAMLNRGLKAEQAAGAEMAKRLAQYDEGRKEFTTYVDRLEKKSSGKSDAGTKSNNECFDADDVGQLRKLWRR